MPNTPPNTSPAPGSVPRSLPWWVAGTVLGLVAAGLTFAAVQLAGASEGHRAKALIQLQPGEQTQPDQLHAVQRYRFLLRSTDLLTRVVADPAVSGLATIKGWADPVAELERRLVVEQIAPDVLEVKLSGDAPEDLKIILDHLVKRFVSDASAFDNKARDEQLASLEKLRASVQFEIELQEKAIEIAGRSGVSGAEAAGNTLQRLHLRHAEADKLFAAVNRDIDKLEAEQKVLRQQHEQREQNPKAFPVDPALVAQEVARAPRVTAAKKAWQQQNELYQKEKESNPEKPATQELKIRTDTLRLALGAIEKSATEEAESRLRTTDAARRQARISELVTQVAIKQEERESLRRERDSIKKVIESTAGNGINIEAMRKAIEPQREMLAKIQQRLLETRLAGDRARVSARGAATVAPVETKPRHLRSVLFATAAFAGGFVLVTGLQATGLAFRVLRRWS